MNIGPLPQALAGKGSVNIVITADGKARQHSQRDNSVTPVLAAPASAQRALAISGEKRANILLLACCIQEGAVELPCSRWQNRSSG